MNELSLVCQLLGTLFNRAPDDAVVTPLLTMIEQGKLKLKPHWPLNQDALLERMQQSVDMSALTADYHALFIEQGGAVSPWRSSYVEDKEEDAVRVFLQQRVCRSKKALLTILARYCWLHHGLKIRLGKMKMSHSLPCLTGFCCRGAIGFFGKVKATPSRHFIARWHY